jgi:hypothetical protein
LHNHPLHQTPKRRALVNFSLAVKNMKKLIVIVSTIFLLFVSFWLGEAGNGLFQFYPFIFGLVGIVALSFLFSKNWKYRSTYALICIVLYATAFYLGNVSFYRAYNACLEDAEQIRIALSDYKDKTGKYPDVLNDLNRTLPCSRCLRGTIFKYESTTSNYRIWFTDWLVEYSATDKEPFLAHK